MKTPQDNAMWLDETLVGLELDKVFLCGLSIGGWNAANYTGFYPKKVIKLILLSPVQALAKMYFSLNGTDTSFKAFSYATKYSF